MRPTLLAAALVALGLAACDGTSNETPTAFDGVAVTAAGGATLRAVGSALVVSGIPAGTDGGFSVPGPAARLDVAVDPLTVPEGGRFGGRVEDAAGGEIASVFAEGTGGGRVRIAFSYGDAAGVTLVRIVYRLRGVAVLTLPEVPVRAGRPVATLLAQSAGEGSGKTGSVHFIRDGGRWVAVSDSEASTPKRSDGGCTGFLLVPPTLAGQLPTDLPLCTDWVEVTPLTGQAAPATRTAVLARGLDGFTVRALSAE